MGCCVPFGGTSLLVKQVNKHWFLKVSSSSEEHSLMIYVPTSGRESRMFFWLLYGTPDCYAKVSTDHQTTTRRRRLRPKVERPTNYHFMSPIVSCTKYFTAMVQDSITDHIFDRPPFFSLSSYPVVFDINEKLFSFSIGRWHSFDRIRS